MKKLYLLLCLAALVFGCTACGKTVTDVTWEQLLQANTLESVLGQVDACRYIEQGDTDDLVYTAVMEEGALRWSCDNGDTTEDCIDGAVYRRSAGEGYDDLSILAGGTTAEELFTFRVGLDALRELPTVGELKLKDGMYVQKLRHTDKELFARTDVTVYFDAGTMLFDRADSRLTWLWGIVKGGMRAEYGEKITLSTPSYDAMTGAEDTVQLTVHSPDGTAKTYTVPRDANIYPEMSRQEETWSLCMDEACTGRVDDLGWVEADRADVYLCEGYVDPASPPMARIRERSQYDRVFRDHYNSFGQSFTYYGADDRWLGAMELSCLTNEEGGLEYYLERIDQEGEEVFSYAAKDGVWYGWTAGDGYEVVLYEDSAYVEERLAEYAFLIGERVYSGKTARDDYGTTVICDELLYDDGAKTAYAYYVHETDDRICRVSAAEYDRDGELTGFWECYIGGNGGRGAVRDIYEECTAPEDGETVKVTVVFGGEKKEYTLRADAALRTDRGELYWDADCTEKVETLQDAQRKKVTVYAP